MFKNITIVIALILSSCAKSQVLSNKEISYLHTIVAKYLVERDGIEKANLDRRTEIFYCMLDIDSMGKVSDINLIADPKNKDSTFYYLCDLRPEAFVQWTSIKCKLRTIMFPVVSAGNRSGPNYVERLLKFYPTKYLEVVKDTPSLIVIDALHYSAPIRED